MLFSLAGGKEKNDFPQRMQMVERIVAGRISIHRSGPTWAAQWAGTGFHL